MGSTPGPVATTDILRAVDAQTGQPFDIIVTVVESASLTPLPATIAMPVGATFEAEIMGSGYFTLTPSEDIVSVKDHAHRRALGRQRSASWTASRALRPRSP